MCLFCASFVCFLWVCCVCLSCVSLMCLLYVCLSCLSSVCLFYVLICVCLVAVNRHVSGPRTQHTHSIPRPKPDAQDTHRRSLNSRQPPHERELCHPVFIFLVFPLSSSLPPSLTPSMDPALPPPPSFPALFLFFLSPGSQRVPSDRMPLRMPDGAR